MKRVDEKMIVFFDLDGTLMSDIFQCYPNALTVLIKLKENGHKAFICTGRGDSMIPADLIEAADGRITLTGGRCVIGSKVIYDQYFPEPVIEQLIKELYEYNIPAFLENDMYLASFGIFLDDSKERQKMMGISNFRFESFESWVCEKRMKRIYKIALREEHSEKLRMLSIFKNGDLNIVSAGGEWVEGVYRDNSKGNAVRNIINELRWDQNNTMCFGDSENDLSMFAACKIGIAVGNAQDIVKKKAVYVTKNACDGGVEWILSRLGMI